MVITSLDNKYIKDILNNNNIFLVEGSHLVDEAYKSKLLLEVILLENEHIDYDIKTIYVNEKVINKISKLESKSKIIGVCKKIDYSGDIKGNILILDNIQDPSNLGMIIRSAVAFSYSTIILSKNSVKYTNDKVIRASQGMIFKVNIIYSDLKEIILKLKEDNYKIIGTDVNQGTELKMCKVNNKHAIVLGNEGSGINHMLYKHFDDIINIKINKECESLNVSIATSIIMHHFN